MTAGPSLTRARMLRGLRPMLHADASTIRRIQTERLARLLAVAARVEPYRSRDRGLAFDGVTPEGLSRIPLLSRAELAAIPLEDRSTVRPVPDLVWYSSGTTAQPMASARTEDENAEQDAVGLRMEPAQGLRGDARGLLLVVSPERGATDLVVEGRRATIPAFASPALLLDAMRRFRPHVVTGPPSSLIEIGDDLGPMRLEGVRTYGEPLDPEARARLRAAYGVDPLDIYASREAGIVAWQCRRRAGGHLNADQVIVEVVDQEGRPVADGEPGEIVVTVLWNRTTPLIRFRTGDVGARLPGRCACGVTLPLMGQVEGRMIDWVAGPDGKRRSPFHLLLGVLGPGFSEAVRRYRITQRAPADFLLEIAWQDGRLPGAVERIRDAYARSLGGSVSVEVRDVAPEDLTGTGKFRIVRRED